MANMTDWSGAPSTLRNSVHLGVWTNWSRGSIMGATLTLNKNHGNLLIAFTAIFIGIVTNRLWQIACRLFHRCYSTAKPRDALHHQRQAILRNSTSAESALYTLVQLTWVWQNITTRAIVRVLPAFLTAAACVVGFTVAGGYSSQISSALNNEVLLNGSNCAIINAPRDADLMSVVTPYDSKRVGDAVNYAQQCYSTTLSTFDCTYFVKNNLHSTVDSSAPCPFSDEICRGKSSNIRLDTGHIDIVTDLGVNIPQDESIQFRTVLQCAPLETRGYTDDETTPAGNFTNYYYGPFLNGIQSQNATYTTQSLSSQYPGQTWDSLSDDRRNMILSTQLYFAEYHNMTPDSSDFEPIPALTRSDGDIMLMFLAGNGVDFLTPTKDPWYRGTVPSDSYSYLGENDSTIAYHPEEAASPLGCIQQFQFCNPALPHNRRCGPLASWAESLVEAAELFNLTASQAFDSEFPSDKVGSRFKWFLTQLFYTATNIHFVLLNLGSKALDSQRLLSEGLLPALPENQWQIDVSRWFTIYLASIQAAVVNSALGPADSSLSDYDILPPNKHVLDVCNSQKILSTRYISFSLFGLYFTFITGMLLIIISFLLEPIFACLYRRHGYREYAYLEWTTTETLQLQRIGFQGMGSGTWLGYTQAIPRTATSETLGNLPLSYSVPGGDSIQGMNHQPTASQPKFTGRVSFDDLLEQNLQLSDTEISSATEGASSK